MEGELVAASLNIVYQCIFVYNSVYFATLVHKSADFERMWTAGLSCRWKDFIWPIMFFNMFSNIKIKYPDLHDF